MAVSALLLAAGVAWLDQVGASLIVRRMIFPLGRMMLLIAVGLAVGQIVEAAGWTGKLGRLGAPLFRFARLGPHCSAAFSVAFVSGASANAMLYEFWKDRKINRKQLILTNLSNQLPAFFLHLPTTVFIVLPLTGWAGGLYFIVTFLAAILRFMLVLAWGRLHPAICAEQAAADVHQKDEKTGINAWRVIKAKLPRRLTAVATYVVPIYTAVFLFNAAGLFDWTRRWLAAWTVSGFLPMESLSFVVLSFAAEFTSGFAAAGALLHQGVLTTKQAVLALLIGNVVAFPIRALRHQLPRLMGIFAPKLGLQILLLGQGIRVVSLIGVGALFSLIY